MRIDLEYGGRRPWWMANGLRLVKALTGLMPPPMLFMTYRPDLFGPELSRYVMHGMSHPGPWTQGEDELFSAFVSNLNSCHY